jgi:hypothetical protein
MAEFISMHYILSQRDDTEYWKHWTNKTMATKFDNMMSYVDNVQRNYHHSSEGGLHCIGTGMHWWPTDKAALLYHRLDTDFEKEFEFYAKRLTERRDMWRYKVEDCPTTYQFLKENFYNE